MSLPNSPDLDSGVSSSSCVANTVSGLYWPRVLLFAKQHGIVAALCLMMAYQIGVISEAQSMMCGV